jgi:hypothetical protein
MTQPPPAPSTRPKLLLDAVKALLPSIIAAGGVITILFMFYGSLADLHSAVRVATGSIGTLTEQTRNLHDTSKEIREDAAKADVRTVERLEKLSASVADMQGDIKVILSRLPKAR